MFVRACGHACACGCACACACACLRLPHAHAREQVINKAVCEFCDFHVGMEMKVRSAGNASYAVCKQPMLPCQLHMFACMCACVHMYMCTCMRACARVAICGQRGAQQSRRGTCAVRMCAHAMHARALAHARTCESACPRPGSKNVRPRQKMNAKRPNLQNWGNGGSSSSHFLPLPLPPPPCLCAHSLPLSLIALSTLHTLAVMLSLSTLHTLSVMRS